MKCQRTQTSDGWECHRCEAYWFGPLAQTDYRPITCPERKREQDELEKKLWGNSVSSFYLSGWVSRHGTAIIP